MVQVVRALEDHSHVHIIMELCSGGDMVRTTAATEAAAAATTAAAAAALKAVRTIASRWSWALAHCTCRAALHLYSRLQSYADGKCGAHG